MASNKYTVSFSGAMIQTTVTNKAAAVSEWVADVMISASNGERIIVGLDCEWKPNSRTFENNKTATLQLCVDTKCLIVQLFYLDYIPQSLKSFVSNRNVVFVGVEVQDDVHKLRCEYGLSCARSEDIQAMAMSMYPSLFYRKPGLKKLALDLVGLVMEKPIQVCRSNWEERVLTLEQVQYACIDAYASYRIGRRLLPQ